MRTVLLLRVSPRPGVHYTDPHSALQGRVTIRYARLLSPQCAYGRQHALARQWLLCVMPGVLAAPGR
jgi:hypothetical protein